jgi:hypothetical protein
MHSKMPSKLGAAAAFCKEVSGLFYEFERKILQKSMINESLKNSALTIRFLFIFFLLFGKNIYCVYSKNTNG